MAFDVQFRKEGSCGMVIETNHGSISSTFYEQNFCEKIPKAEKDTDDLTVFLRFLDLRT